MADPSEKAASSRNRFGTFGGVFTPSILTILGVVMFMRANFVVGQAGILGAVIILIIAKSISLLTTFSVSAISTNTRVKGGGSYYLISRSLGPEFGGSIGIAYFCALALSVPFYVLGFTEALMKSVPTLAQHGPNVPLYISLGTAVVLFAVAFVGAGWAIRTQYIIMTFLFLAIVAFVGGQVIGFEPARFAENWSGATVENLPCVPVLTFWAVFAIYFPAVTGVDAGLNMSGDLKDPGKSIPRGMLAAVGVGFAVYLAQILLGGGSYPRADMAAEPFESLKDNALFGGVGGVLVVLGVFAATLSSALGSYLGAPRVLQAVSRDRIVRSLGFFAKGSAKGDEPRRALALAGVVTVAVILWANFSEGDALNAVAPVITMFFLYTYGMMNAAAFVEAVGDNPSFRPRFRLFHWITAGAGALGCVVVSVLISPPAAVTAIALVAGFYWYISRQHLRAQFGDARRGWVFASAMRNLSRLATMGEDAKNWRPTPLVFTGNPASREVLIRYAVWLEAGHGIMILANVLEGRIEEHAPLRQAALKQLADYCADDDVHAFPLAVVADDRDQGIRTALQAASVGPIRPNLAVMGWATDPERAERHARSLRVAASLGMGLVLIENRGMPPPPTEEKRIDVWWRGRKNGSLMLLLAHLLTTNDAWARTKIRVLRVVESAEGHGPAVESLRELAQAARIESDAHVLVSDRPYAELLHENSRDATCVFLGFEPPAEGTEAAWHESYGRLLAPLPTAILVSSRGTEDLEA
ncbi:MAG: amino acid permease [Planctomycetota bacterium]